MSRTSYEPSGIVISATTTRGEIKFVIRFVHVWYHVISLKNRQTELVISVTQIYGGEVIRREDGALSAQRKRQRHDGKKRSTNTKISQHLVELFKFTRVYRLQKPQTHLSAETLIRLIGRAIVFYRRSIVLEISHQFLRRSKIAETVKIHDAIVPLRVRYPMSTRPRRIVQIHDTAFVSAHAARR